ncbi:hypothetical protein ATCC90586_006334 [Pythium insidiosum]|nr:hypothetical protein ATCC90586_006334 [Pythium insidiosum]
MLRAPRMRRVWALAVLALSVGQHALAQTPTGPNGIDFASLGESSNNEEDVGRLNRAGVNADANMDTAALVAVTPVPSSTLAPPAPDIHVIRSDFSVLNGSYDAARVSDKTMFPAPTPVVVATQAPIVHHSNNFALLNGSVDPARLGETPAPPTVSVVVLSNAASVAFSALPVSSSNDIQGFPFADAPTTAATESVVVAATPAPSPLANGTQQDDSWWQQQVCASSPESCAVVSSKGMFDRRLAVAAAAAATVPAPGDLSGVEKSLREAATFRLASNLMLVAASFASTGVGLLLGAFAIVLCIFFAISAGEAVRQLLIANVEFCSRGRENVLWTTEVLLEHELIASVQQFGRSLPSNLTDPQELATRVADHVNALLGSTLAFFKVYVAATGSFNATTNAANVWTSLPDQSARDERGWTVVPTFYSSIADGKPNVFDALVMWGTTPCTGCTDAFVAQVAGYAKQASVSIAKSRLVAGGKCQRAAADGGGDIFVCLNNQNP